MIKTQYFWRQGPSQKWILEDDALRNVENRFGDHGESGVPGIWNLAISPKQTLNILKHSKFKIWYIY